MKKHLRLTQSLSVIAEYFPILPQLSEATGHFGLCDKAIISI